MPLSTNHLIKYYESSIYFRQLVKSTYPSKSEISMESYSPALIYLYIFPNVCFYCTISGPAHVHVCLRRYFMYAIYIQFYSIFPNLKLVSVEQMKKLVNWVFLAFSHIRMYECVYQWFSKFLILKHFKTYYCQIRQTRGIKFSFLLCYTKFIFEDFLYLFCAQKLNIINDIIIKRNHFEKVHHREASENIFFSAYKLDP